MVEKAVFSYQLFHPKYWLLWLAVALLRLSQLLPLQLQMKLGKWIGRLFQVFAGRRVHIAKRNIELCFPQMSAKERACLLRRNFEETGKAIFDIANAWWWPNDKVQQHMRITGQKHIEQTLNDGQGVILFAVHCLPLEMGARIFGQFQPGIGVYRPHNNLLMEYFQVKGRLRSNKGLIAKRDLRQMVRSLRKPEVIWYTSDQDFGRSGAIFVPFFAVDKAATITGATTLAKLGKAKVLPFVVERNEQDNGYHITIQPPLDDFPGENEHEDAQRTNQIIEKIINHSPTQYMWLHRRFKTRPQQQDSSLYD